MDAERPVAVHRSTALVLNGLIVVGAVLVATGGLWLFLLRRSFLPADWAVGATPGALIVVGLFFLAGALGVSVLAPAFGGSAAAWQGVGSHRLVISSTLLVIVLSNLGPIVYSFFRPVEGLCSVPGFMTAALSVGCALIGVTYLRFIRPGILTTADLGVRVSSLSRHVAAGLLVGIMVLSVSAAIQLLLSGLGVRQTQLQDLQCIKNFPLSGFLAVVFAGGVLAPIAEELFFRGFVFRTYLRTRGPLLAYVFSSVLFAGLHLNLAALLPILALALILCGAYHRTGSIVPGVIGHGLNNSVAFVILYFSNIPA